MPLDAFALRCSGKYFTHRRCCTRVFYTEAFGHKRLDTPKRLHREGSTSRWFLNICIFTLKSFDAQAPLQTTRRTLFLHRMFSICTESHRYFHTESFCTDTQTSYVSKAIDLTFIYLSVTQSVCPHRGSLSTLSYLSITLFVCMSVCPSISLSLARSCKLSSLTLSLPVYTIWKLEKPSYSDTDASSMRQPFTTSQTQHILRDFLLCQKLLQHQKRSSFAQMFLHF